MDKTYILSQLNEALDKNLKKVKNTVKPDMDIIIFGTGNTTSLYQKCFLKENIQPKYYADNNQNKWGTLFHHILVISPDKLKHMKNILVLVCSSDCNTNDVIGIQLDKLGVNWLRVDEFVFAKRKKEIVNCVQKFADDESLKIYADVIIKRMKNEHIYKFDRYQYFSLPVFLERNHKEIFVDMGAFVGDTIEEYISTRMGAFGGVFAFEPYKPNFQAMNYRLERLKKEWAIGENKIFPILAGVGEKSKKCQFQLRQIIMTD
ncbi:hypothetical protein [Pectinatus frisingensis]|uniref:hypothetical protein n=1 Tax=Pectinatus frisingensis TaxID=865 RepID=UPI003D809B4C